MSTQPRTVQQDYIVRQRYSNALPPPSGAPKLLEVPSNALKRFNMPFFATPLHQSQPMNIEVDGMLGMPIDLVGVPGVFAGDESAIQAPLVTPAVHPRDRNLLRPLKTLGKSHSENADISFLRRTQYTAEDRARVDGKARNNRRALPKRRVDSLHDDPITILRSIIKSFDVAHPERAYTGPDTAENIRGLVIKPAERDAWTQPRHPSKPELQALDTYEILPDFDAATHEVTYGVIRLTGNPTGRTDAPDTTRLQASFLHQLEPSPAAEAEHTAAREAHAANPDVYPDPGPLPADYHLFVPEDEQTATNLKRKLDVNDPEHGSASLYTHSRTAGPGAEEDEQEADAAADSFRLSSTRFYSTARRQDHGAHPYQEIAVALVDDPPGAGRGGQAGALYVPIHGLQQLKPRRAGELDTQLEDQRIDYVHVTVRDMDPTERERREGFRAMMDTQDEE